MMNKVSLFLSFALLIGTSQSLTAQEKRFFMPKEIQQAYEKGTRSYDGSPGPNYWQNTVEYDIEVEVIPAEKKLKGTETAIFHNNSPDDLDRVLIRFYHDAFREANPRANRVRLSDITDGVTINKLTINREEIDPTDVRRVNRSTTNMRVFLSEALKAGDQLSLEVEWEQQIPETTIRTGAYDSTSYFLAYWYPQIAVYDDVFGWDFLSYDFSTEFYNNLGNFKVSITAPENFTVISTGVLQNPEEILQSTQLDRYNKAKTTSETVNIITNDDLDNDLNHKSGTWTYEAKEVPDFAFCLSDHFCWDAATQQVDGREVLIHSFYQQALANNAKELTANQVKMMKHFSEDAPGIPYPYPEFSTFVSGAGGGGMEYPMMANNGNPGLGVTVHEMFHTYFPMYVRTNEKRFAWMDEGWADFTTALITNRYFNNDDSPLYGQFATQITGTLGSISDLPLITSTQFMDNSNYGYASYPLPAFLYSVLFHHLGEEVFMNCWRTYIKRWAKKSPTPYDFIYTFENVSGQDLSWFWKPWFFEFGNVDVDIQSYNKGKLVLENKGTRPVPVSLQINYTDGSTENKDYSASVWKDGDIYNIKLDRAKEIEAVAVNYNVPDAEILANFYPPLQDRYKEIDIPKDMLGEYPLNGYNARAVISLKDDILHFALPEAGISNYLKPKAAGSFESLGGGVKIEFQQKDKKYTGLTLEIASFGFKATASKR